MGSMQCIVPSGASLSFGFQNHVDPLVSAPNIQRNWYISLKN